MNNLKAVEKVIERIKRQARSDSPVITVHDLLRAFRAYDSEVEELSPGPEPQVDFNPGDRCPTCGWTVPRDTEYHDASTRMSPSGHVYATKPREVMPKPDALSEDEYRLLMLRAIRLLGHGESWARQGSFRQALDKAVDCLRKRLRK